MSPAILRYTAFSADPDGGNPAGVVLAAGDLEPNRMQQIAADLGYSESAFLTGPIGTGRPIRIRYFAPEGEVDFCGHATIATAAAISEHLGPGEWEFTTNVGAVRASGTVIDGVAHGALDSPPTGALEFGDGELDLLLAALGWAPGVLHPDFVPAIGTAGNLHPVLVLKDLDRLAALAYDFDTLQRLCRDRGWVTVQLITPTGTATWQARDPFPWGGVVEDPATGSAAAAFTGYLRARGRLQTGDRLSIAQGVEMGRPSTIEVLALADRARVSGPAVPID